MLKRKLYTAVLISCLIVAAVATASISVGPKTASYKAAPGTVTVHQFDSNGLCSCIPVTTPEMMEQAPRIEINKTVSGFVTAYNKKNGYYLDKAKQKVEGYFDIIESVLEEYELPTELKYLAFIESGLKKITSSSSGAKGPWALMPLAAKQYGLKISGKDERLDYRKSTEAAARLLKDLYKQYGDWLVVIAAYNSGPGGIEKAMKKSGSRNYWSLHQYLPDETRSHIKRFIAVHYQFEKHGSLVTMSKAETEAHVQAVTAFIAKQTQLPTIVDSVTVAPGQELN